MDFDLLSGFLAESQPDLLSNLQSRRQTDDRHATTEDPTRMRPSNQAGAVISKIEDIFESIADCLLDEKKELVIRLKTRGKPGTHIHDLLTSTIKSLPTSEARTIKFPSKSPQEAWKFSTFRSPRVKVF